ncbi:MAG: Mur ligase family protein [Minisyncoccia bacterium]
MSTKPIIGIAGFGMEGKAAYEYFKDKAELHIFDEAPVDAAGLTAAVHRGLDIPADIETLYKTPGIPTSKLRLASPATYVTTLTDLLLSRVHAQAVGVTGTKGKSTVAALVHHIMKGAGRDVELLGNIGVVNVSIIDAPIPGRVYVFELSSYQCEYLKHSPHVAVLTNLYQEHLSHHGSFERYREAKLNIARFQSEKDVFINGTDLEPGFRGRVVRPKSSTSFETQLLGEHNQRNCALAVAAVGALGISEAEACEHIKTFAPLQYRLEKIGEHRGATFYDDSLATIPEATLASIAALGRVDTLILGGQDRGIDFAGAAEALARTPVKTFIIFPDTGARMTEHINDREVLPVFSMEEAVRAAYAHTPEGGVVLLSNASPSFNLFKDYKDKSAQYRKWIVELANA